METRMAAVIYAYRTPTELKPLSKVYSDFYNETIGGISALLINNGDRTVHAFTLPAKRPTIYGGVKVFL